MSELAELPKGKKMKLYTIVYTFETLNVSYSDAMGLKISTRIFSDIVHANKYNKEAFELGTVVELKEVTE